MLLAASDLMFMLNILLWPLDDRGTALFTGTFLRQESPEKEQRQALSG